MEFANQNITFGHMERLFTTLLLLEYLVGAGASYTLSFGSKFITF